MQESSTESPVDCVGDRTNHTWQLGPKWKQGNDVKQEETVSETRDRLDATVSETRDRLYATGYHELRSIQCRWEEDALVLTCTVRTYYMNQV